MFGSGGNSRCIGAVGGGTAEPDDQGQALQSAVEGEGYFRDPARRPLKAIIVQPPKIKSFSSYPGR